MAARTLTEKIIEQHLVGSPTKRSSCASTRCCSRTRRARWPASSSSGSASTASRSRSPSRTSTTTSSSSTTVTRTTTPTCSSFAARYGLLYSRPGNGISHYLHLERFARPGQFLARRRQPHDDGGRARHARDRRRRDGGRGRDGGHGRSSLERPLIVGVELAARSSRGCSRRTSCSSCCGGAASAAAAAASSSSSATASRRLSAPPTAGRSATWSWRPARRPGSSRATSARASGSRSQGRAEQFDRAGGRPGRGATTRRRSIELGALEPLIALPSSPGNVVPVREVAGTETRRSASAARSTPRYEDLAIVAAVLRDESCTPRSTSRSRPAPARSST